MWALLTYFPVYRPYLNTWLPRAWVFFAVGMALAVVSEWAREERDPEARRTGSSGPWARRRARSCSSPPSRTPWRPRR
ncbi:hypothetical protein [Microbispora sp. GKU 823]|uniref:hypothetical protein n=1 Tax=Microbispora sp. GKU 823 TaxID=1652100 RepID=UPI002118C985|nr:hypothetical protein [Microbispora sp. GKU 823]